MQFPQVNMNLDMCLQMCLTDMLNLKILRGNKACQNISEGISTSLPLKAKLVLQRLKKGCFVVHKTFRNRIGTPHHDWMELI